MEVTIEIIEQLIDAVPGGCIAYEVIDEELKIIGYTKGLVRKAGYTIEKFEEIIKNDSYGFVYELDRKLVKNKIRECVNGDGNLMCSYRIRTKNNMGIWVNSRGKIIGKIDGKPVVFTTIQDMSMANRQKDIINNIATGIGIYAIENEEPFQIFLNDGYFKMLNIKKKNREEYYGKSAMIDVHPDDKEKIKKVIKNAIEGTGEFHTTFRILTHKNNEYVWVHADARIADEEDGKDIFYATYTNITELKNTEVSLEKTKASLITALTSSNQLCFEYDPVLKTAEGYTDVDLFNLPNSVNNYPECLIEAGIFHPDDVQLVKDTINMINEGKDCAECDVRIKIEDNYKWYQCIFKKYFDPIKNYNIAICNIRDISVLKEAATSYYNHLNTIMRINPDSIATFRMNLSKNICDRGSTKYKNIMILQDSGTVTGFFKEAEQSIDDENDRRVFRETFTIEAMLKAFEEGKHTISLEHRYELEPNRIEWIQTAVDMMTNPETGDIVGILYTKNNSNSMIKSRILKEILHKDYEKIAIFYKNRNGYFLFNNMQEDYDTILKDFWIDGIHTFLDYAREEMRDKYSKELTRENIYQTLDENGEVSRVFHGIAHNRRYQIYFRYLDEKKSLVMAALRDITDEALLERLRYDSTHDVLTGIFNRENSFRECNIMLEKHPNEQFYMIHFDIKKFRLYNSFFGDKEGDELLKYIANMFRELYFTHEYGVFGRIEADVFLLCFPYKENTISWNEKYIHEKLQNYREDFVINGSCGVYLATAGTMTAEEMFNRATIAAKEGKERQIGAVTLYSNKMETNLNQEHDIVKDMRSAIEQEQFVVYYQPKYKMLTGEPYGAEALVRWNHPEKGLISPGLFIPLFESNGFITTLDRYMWEHVCETISKWLKEGKNPAPISVNVSRVSMYSPRTVPFLKELIKKYKIDPSLLNLELTESAYMDNPEEMKSRLKELQKFGFEIMMDDFGSGYSSLNTLREIPVDYLKVDREFLATVDQSKRSRLVIASVIHMASRMGIPVITEGVETEEQRDFLLSIGCDYVQGFLYAKPMPLSDYERNIINDKMTYEPNGKDIAAELSKITMNMDVEIQEFSNLLPHPLAFVDYTSDTFTYLSANSEFQRKFGLSNDIEDMEELIEKHISKDDYDVLKETYEKVATAMKPEECFINWIDNNGKTLYYLVRVQYIGKSAYSTIMTSTFIDLTEFYRNIMSVSHKEASKVLNKNIYTMKEITEYIKLLNKIFDVARLVKPREMEVITADANYNPVCETGYCYSYWGNSSRCKNCSTLECIIKNKRMVKIEKREHEYYLVASNPVRIYIGPNDETDTMVIETVTKLTKEVMSVLSNNNGAISETIEELQSLIYEDPLTHCYNRRYFNELKYLKDPNPGFKKGDCVCFIMMDLDGFKKINDLHGHSVGDQILIQLSDTLRKNVRPIDSVIRFGGDEFLIIFHNCPEEQLEGAIDRIRKVLNEFHYGENNEINVNGSLGYSYRERFIGSTTQISEMINEADKMLYSHKDYRK